MRDIVLSPRAEADLEEIWDYTVARWSEDRAERYIRDIWQAIGTVGDKPDIGLPCDDVRLGYRKYRVGSHVLFFRDTGTAIDIVRILHQRMDFGRHL